MTKIIAVLLALRQFEVVGETSKGYFVATYPDTEPDRGEAVALQEVEQVPGIAHQFF